MKRGFLILAALVALATPARAQFTQVSGTVTDPMGVPYAGGTVSMRLVPTGTAPTVGGLQFSAQSAATLDSTGSFIAQLADNNLVTPGGTQWVFTVCATPGVAPPWGFGSVCFTSAPITITGASQSVSAALSALATALVRDGRARYMAPLAADPATCDPNAGEVYFNTATVLPRYCSAPNTWSSFGTGIGANTSLSNLGVTAINAHLLFNADNTYDVGSATNAPRNIYFWSLIGKGSVTSIEGPVSACTVSAANNGRTHFTSTGPQWSYNTAACQSLLLGNTATTVSSPTGSLAGVVPRVLSTTNCTTEGNCATTNEVDADAGQQGTTETNFASNWSMPANFLTTNKAIQVCGVFRWTSTGTPPTLIIRFKAGATTLTGGVATAPTASVTRGFVVCYLLQGTAAPGAAVSVEAGFMGTSGPGIPSTNNTIDQPVAGIATNGALTIQISAQWGAATTGNTVQLHQFYVLELWS